MKILTALGNDFLYNKIKSHKEFNLYKNDILYREGILEILNKNKYFDIIIIYEKIIGEINFKDLINKIKIINNKIKIFFILEEKNEKLEKILYEENVTDIFYNNKINFNEFIFELKNNNCSKEELLKKENKKLKEIILLKNQEIEKYKKKKKIFNLKNKKIVEKINNNYFFKNKIKKIEKEKNISLNNGNLFILFIEDKNNTINFKILENVLKRIIKNKIILEKIKLNKKERKDFYGIRNRKQLNK